VKARFGVEDRVTAASLKAWAMDLDPNVLHELSSLLALAGYRHEARGAAEIVAMWFPSYAPRFYWGIPDTKLVESLRTSAIELLREIGDLPPQTRDFA
jgi:hypothetical protein